MSNGYNNKGVFNLDSDRKARIEKTLCVCWVIRIYSYAYYYFFCDAKEMGSDDENSRKQEEIIYR